MARLPTVGADDGSWGTVLNEFLSVSHDSSGSLKNQPINVKDYGATGDGVTDDTAAINEALAALPSGYGITGNNSHIYFPRGTYLVSDTLDFKNRYRQNITGDHAIIRTKTGSDFTGKSLANFSGSENTTIKGLNFRSTLTSNKPTASVLFGRNGTGSGGDLHFENCFIEGDCTVATVLWAHTDTSSMRRCTINSTGSTPAILFTTHNDSGLLDWASSTLKINSFESCFIHSYIASCSKLMVMQGLVQHIKFDSCYFYAASTAKRIISIEDSPSAGTANQVHHLQFSNCDVEGTAGADGLFIHINNSYGLNYLTMHNFTWDPESDYIIKIDSLNASYGLFDSTITPTIGKAYSATKVIHLAAGRLQSTSLDCNSNDIYTESGTIAQYNYVRCIDGINPFGSSAGTISENVVMDRSGRFNVGRIGFQEYDVPSGETYAYANAGILNFNNASSTTVVNILSHIPGQVVYCIFANGNTTMTHDNGGIRLAGSVNWNAPANATLTLINTGPNQWSEVSRMVP